MRNASTALLLGLVVTYTSAQSGSKISGTASTSGPCSAATVGSDVSLPLVCVVIVESKTTTRTLTVRLTDDQLNLLADLVAQRVIDKLQTNPHGPNVEYASDTKPSDSFVLGQSTQLTGAGSVGQYSSITSLQSLGSTSQQLQLPSVAGSYGTLWDSVQSMKISQEMQSSYPNAQASWSTDTSRLLQVGMSANSYSLFDLRQYGIGSTTSDASGSLAPLTSQIPFVIDAQAADSDTLLKIDTMGLKSDVFTVLSSSRPTDFGAMDKDSGGTLQIGSDGSLKFTFSQAGASADSTAALYNAFSLLNTSHTDALNLSSASDASQLGTLFVSNNGIVAVDGIALKAEDHPLGISVSSTNGIMNSTAPALGNDISGIINSTNTSTSCVYGTRLVVSPDGIVMPCPLTAPATNLNLSPKN